MGVFRGHLVPAAQDTTTLVRTCRGHLVVPAAQDTTTLVRTCRGHLVPAAQDTTTLVRTRGCFLAHLLRKRRRVRANHN